ncbi:hypothetical protein BASA81_004851 [Batrachochytrium salamandrivorans]|nr:hypothetical protein BASA81_004851 [Batrachochytrium salamandrivorans]
MIIFLNFPLHRTPPPITPSPAHTLPRALIVNTMLIKLIAVLFCWTVAIIVSYNWQIAPKIRLTQMFEEDSPAPKRRPNKVELWRKYVRTLDAQVSTPLSLTSTTSSAGLKSIVLVFTPTPEPEIHSLLQQLVDIFPTITLMEEGNPLHDAERKLFINPIQQDWREFPYWVHSEPELAGMQDFQSQVLQQEFQSILYHSNLLPQTLPQWIKIAKEGGIEITCILAKRSSLSEQVYLAMDSMAQNRMSALEMKRVLKRRLQFLNQLCSSWNRMEFDYSLDHWTRILVGFNYTKELRNHTELDSIYLQALGNTRDVMRRIDGEAYISILTASTTNLYTTTTTTTNLLPDYLQGVVGLGRSLSFFDSSRERILMVTKPEKEMDTMLQYAAKQGGWTLLSIEPIEDLWFANSERGCMFRATRAHQNIRWGKMASKLRAFQLIHKQALLYLDLDVVITGQVSELFNQVPDDFVCISEGGVQHTYLNAGFLFLRPNLLTFQGLMDRFNLEPPRIFRNLIDCTEMGLLNAYFGQPERLREEEEEEGKHYELIWPHRENQTNGRTGTLPLGAQKWTVGRPDTARDFIHHPPLAVHFIRKDICPKPWEMCNGGQQFEPAMLRRMCQSFPYVAWCALRGNLISNF